MTTVQQSNAHHYPSKAEIWQQARRSYLSDETLRNTLTTLAWENDRILLMEDIAEAERFAEDRGLWGLNENGVDETAADVVAEIAADVVAAVEREWQAELATKPDWKSVRTKEQIRFLHAVDDRPPPANEAEADERQSASLAELRRLFPADNREDPRGRSISDVLKVWRTEGPLVHEPTGFGVLDKLTGGGLVYGSRIYANGQPDAGKTLLLLQIAHEYAKRGIVVGLLAVDEEDTDLATRFAQRVGHSRKACEIRDPMVLDQIEAELTILPIRFYDATWTIEKAAADLATIASNRGEKRMFLGIDSLQTVSCDAESQPKRELSEMAQVTARVQAIRNVATKYKLIAFVTSEMSRGAYRKADPSDLTSTMAASKHSGAVEYSARVLLGLRSVKGESDLIEVDVAKNKLGPSGDTFHLKIDRSTQTLWEVGYDAPPKPEASDRRLGKVVQDAEQVRKLIEATPDMTTRELHSTARARLGLGKDAVDAAVAHLGTALTITDGPRRSKLMRLCDCAD